MWIYYKYDKSKEINIKIAHVIILMTQLKLKILILAIFNSIKSHTSIPWFIMFHAKL